MNPVPSQAAPALIKALDDGNGNVRRTAAEALIKIPSEADMIIPALVGALKHGDYTFQVALRKMGAPAVPALVEALKDERWVARKGAANVLGMLGRRATESAPALLEALKDERREVRAAAARALGGIGAPPDEAVPALVHALEDEFPSVRRRAAEALGKLGTPSRPAAPALIRASKDKHADVRGIAVWALGSICPKASDAVSAFIHALSDKDANVRIAAARALARSGPAAKQAAGKLIEALRDSNRSVRFLALAALGRVSGDPKGTMQASPALIRALILALKNEEGNMRSSVARALGKIEPGAKEAIPALTEALKDQYGPVRTRAAESLVKLGLPDRGLDFLIAELHDESGGHRAWAARLLGKAGAAAKGAIPALTEALKDEQEQVRRAAAETLVKLGLPVRALPVLIATLKDGPAYRRKWAAWTLGKVGAPAKGAIPALKEALKDKEVRRAAAWALKKIQADGSPSFDAAQDK